MKKNRLEAFSDGVIAIIIAIMVLEMKVPHGTSLNDLVPLIPVFLSYALSFVYVGIYWNNHHHLLHITQEIRGWTLWANLHLLFWLSLVPFATAWMGENNFQQMPVALYGCVMLLAGIAYFLLAKTLVCTHGKDSDIAFALGRDVKSILSLVLYAIAIPATFASTYISLGIYALVAALWFMPDPRIEKRSHS